jgi:hypothetical protein
MTDRVPLRPGFERPGGSTVMGVFISLVSP